MCVYIYTYIYIYASLYQVAANSGMDPTDVLNKLRMKHAHGEKWFGVDVIENGVCDTMKAFVWEATVRIYITISLYFYI